jgi:hypothetical protein
MKIFVTAKLKGSEEIRQGWLESYTIIGESGTKYTCEGIPIKVENHQLLHPKWFLKTREDVE